MVIKCATRTVNLKKQKQEVVEDGVRGERQTKMRFCGQSTKKEEKVGKEKLTAGSITRGGQNKHVARDLQCT